MTAKQKRSKPMKDMEVLKYTDRKKHPHKKNHCELCGLQPHRGLFVRWAQNDNRELCIWCVRLNNKAHSLIINKKSEREDFYKQYGDDGHPLKVCPASYWEPVKKYQSKEPYDRM